jgi:hypothetical protein
VDQTNWSFQFRNSSFITEALGTSEPDRRLDFATAAELVRYLAVDDQDDAGPIQSKINERIDGDLIATAWRKARTRLKDLKHFPKYRKNKYELYHTATRTCMSGTATPKEETLFQGLRSTNPTSWFPLARSFSTDAPTGKSPAPHVYLDLTQFSHSAE